MRQHSQQYQALTRHYKYLTCDSLTSGDEHAILLSGKQGEAAMQYDVADVFGAIVFSGLLIMAMAL